MHPLFVLLITALIALSVSTACVAAPVKKQVKPSESVAVVKSDDNQTSREQIVYQVAYTDSQLDAKIKEAQAVIDQCQKTKQLNHRKAEQLLNNLNKTTHTLQRD